MRWAVRVEGWSMGTETGYLSVDPRKIKRKRFYMLGWLIGTQPQYMHRFSSRADAVLALLMLDAARRNPDVTFPLSVVEVE